MKREGEKLDCFCVLKLIPIKQVWLLRLLNFLFWFSLVRPGFENC